MKYPIVALVIASSLALTQNSAFANILDLPGTTFRAGHPQPGETLEEAIGPASDREINGLRALRITAARLKEYPNVLISISGHVDPNECREYECHDLAVRRARLVYHYLLKQGIAPERLFQLTSYGSTRPLETDSKSADRSGNRRVDIDEVPDI